jgi:hypothetical protein
VCNNNNNNTSSSNNNNNSNNTETASQIIVCQQQNTNSLLLINKPATYALQPHTAADTIVITEQGKRLVEVAGEMRVRKGVCVGGGSFWSQVGVLLYSSSGVALQSPVSSQQSPVTSQQSPVTSSRRSSRRSRRRAFL